jgi:rhodanese-related sulfurtransferase
MRSIALAICLAALGCGGAQSVSPTLGTPATHVTGREARSLVAHGAVLLDVRSEFEYAIGHLDGAINIPVDDLPRRTSELDPHASIVVYCLSGHRSEQAGRVLTGAGFDHVRDLGSITSY